MLYRYDYQISDFYLRLICMVIYVPSFPTVPMDVRVAY